MVRRWLIVVESHAKRDGVLASMDVLLWCMVGVPGRGISGVQLWSERRGESYFGAAVVSAGLAGAAGAGDVGPFCIWLDQS
jgi:hypothetical protein